MSTSVPSSRPSTAGGAPEAPSQRPATFSWSVADILIATVLGVVSGFVFVLYDGPGAAAGDALGNIIPGLSGLMIGPWLFAATLVGCIIRKPGAAIYGEVIAASVEAAWGNQWGIGVLWSGIAQGLGAEIILAAFVYRRFGMVATVLAGMGSGIGAWIWELIRGNAAKGVEFNVVYLITVSISGAVLAGIAVYALIKALAATGALDKVAAGRHNRVLV